eukprot:TRINITY_DN16865_c0_g1_i1.p1 TRINITY_DN16865_c0_g1~~TRINITY_DN16865_c0_g1_i1.p1  ORF type:complete len:367 (+),score=113.96 TRINITY_DN16865_c0_g1_i1:165-1265(+)
MASSSSSSSTLSHAAIASLVNSSFTSVEEMVASEATNTTLTGIQLDGLVVMKIIKHCKDYLPEIVTGQLLGLHIGGVLEVTNSFPFPNRPNDEDQEDTTTTSSTTANAEDGAEYQIEMMRCLREVNVDNNTVGWYTSTYLGSFLDETLISTQYNYQITLPKSVVLVYDPLRTAQGSLALWAYRLTQQFMDLYGKYSATGFTKEALEESGGLSFQNIFEQIPVRISNSQLVQAMLYDLEDRDPGLLLSSHFDRLDLSTNPFLEKNLESLLESLDDLASEQNKQQYYQKSIARQQQQQANYLARRRAELGTDQIDEDLTTNPLFKTINQPSRLESLLITNQINNYCEQINSFAGSAFTKLFLFGALQK